MINVQRFTKQIPLYVRRNNSVCSASIYYDFTNKQLTASASTSVIKPSAYHAQFSVNPHVSRLAMTWLFQNIDFLKLVEEMHMVYEKCGENKLSELLEAGEKVQEFISVHTKTGLVTVWQADEYFADGRIASNDSNTWVSGDITLTADTTEDQIAMLIDQEQSNINAVIYGAYDYLLDIVQELRVNR